MRKSITRSSMLAAALAAATSGVALAAAAAPVAQTENGRVTGVVANGMQEFLGIRYAAPPVGPLRWQPPQPVAEAMATHDATALGPHCAQPVSAYGVASDTEDCLYLNVFRPQKPPRQGAAKLPVMVWIHGGALVVGESDDYVPTSLVNTGGVIVVTINYRLGYFGFLATSGLDAEGHVAVNYGFQDQQFALAWVQRNIAGFGGDPARVTIAGESAGGLSVLSNLISPPAYGTFNAAIVESGGYSLQLPSLTQDESIGAGVAGALHCAPADTACLRGATTDQIVAQEGAAGLSIIPGVDGTTLPSSINTALASGHFTRVPVLNGSNHDEYRQFLSPDAGLTASEYPAVLAGLYGPDLGAAVAAEYKVGRFSKPVYALAAAVSDSTFICTARQIDRWVSRYVPVYGYEFNDRRAPQDFLAPVAGYDFGAAHASELQFLFTLEPLAQTVRSLTPAEHMLSTDMVRYWTNFARAYSPDGANVPYWPNYAPVGDDFESLQPGNPAVETDFSHVHHCKFWEKVINPS